MPVANHSRGKSLRRCGKASCAGTPRVWNSAPRARYPATRWRMEHIPIEPTSWLGTESRKPRILDSGTDPACAVGSFRRELGPSSSTPARHFLWWRAPPTVKPRRCPAPNRRWWCPGKANYYTRWRRRAPPGFWRKRPRASCYQTMASNTSGKPIPVTRFALPTSALCSAPPVCPWRTHPCDTTSIFGRGQRT